MIGDLPVSHYSKVIIRAATEAVEEATITLGPYATQDQVEDLAARLIERWIVEIMGEEKGLLS